MVKLEEVGKGLALLERNDGQQGVTCERQIESGVGPSMAMTILLPRGGIAFVVVAIFDAPVPTDGTGGAGFFFRRKAGEEDAGMVPGRLGFFLFAPVALDA